MRALYPMSMTLLLTVACSNAEFANDNGKKAATSSGVPSDGGHEGDASTTSPPTASDTDTPTSSDPASDTSSDTSNDTSSDTSDQVDTGFELSGQVIDPLQGLGIDLSIKVTAAGDPTLESVWLAAASGATAPADCANAVEIALPADDKPYQFRPLIKGDDVFSFRLCVKQGDALQPNATTLENVALGHYSVIFNTSDTVYGDFGGITVGDAHCAALAKAAGLKGAWRVILSDDATDAKSRFDIKTPIYTTSGELFAANEIALWSGHDPDARSRDENGQIISDDWSYTGTDQNGLRHVATQYPALSSNCLNWTTRDGGHAAQSGGTRGGGSTRHWLGKDAPSESNHLACSNPERLYCLSQPASTP